MPGLDARVAEDALLGLAAFPVVVNLFVGAGRDAHAPAAALVLIDQHDAVFFALVDRPRRTRRDAGRVQAVLAQPRQVHHEGLFKLAVDVLLHRLEVGVAAAFGELAAENLLPVRAPLDLFHSLPADQTARTCGRRGLEFGRLVQVLVVEGEGLVIGVDFRQVGVGENLHQDGQARALPGLQLAACRASPAALPFVLVFPFLGVADAGFRFDVVEPGVFHPGSCGPDLFAGHGAGVAADAFVEVEHHADLGANFHCVSPVGVGSGLRFDVVRTLVAVGRARRLVHPVHLVHLAHDAKGIAIGADRAVVIQAKGELRIAADHVRWFEHHAGDRVVHTAPGLGDLRRRGIDRALLGVVHHGHTWFDALADHGAGDERAIGVEHLDPVVVDDPCLFGIVLGNPHAGSATAEREHDQAIGIGAMDAPLLVRRDPVQHDFLVPGELAKHRLHGLEVDRGAIQGKTFAEGPHPGVVLVEMLPPAQRAPRNVFMDIGVAGVVANLFIDDARPGRRVDHPPGLRHDVPETNLLVFSPRRHVAEIQSGFFRQGSPGLGRDVSIGFRRKHHHHLGGVDVAQNPRPAFSRAGFTDPAVECAQSLDLLARIPRNAMTVTAVWFVHQRPKRCETLAHMGIVTLHLGDVRSGLAGNEFHFPAFPVAYLQSLTEFRCAVMHQRGEHHIALDAEVPNTDLGKLARDPFEYLPIRTCLPGGIDGRRQRMDEGVHVGGVEVIFLVPSRRRQQHVGEQTGAAHAKVQCDQQVELAFGGIVAPLHFVRAWIIGAEFATEHTVVRSEQMFEEVLRTLARGAQQVGAPDEHIARPVHRVVRVFAAHVQGSTLEAVDHMVFGGKPGCCGVARQVQGIGLELRRRGQPAHALGAHVVVDHAAAECLGIGQGREDFIDPQFFVAPLIGVRVEKTGGIHLARRFDPIQCKRQHRPARLRAKRLLPDVMRPAAAGHADTAAHHQHVDDGPVIHVGVVPVVDPGAEDHH